MNTLVVEYDLCQEESNYKDLIDYINNYPIMCKLTKSTWLIKTDKTCVIVRDEIMNLLKKEDRVFVAKLTGEAAWYNTLSSSETIKFTI